MFNNEELTVVCETLRERLADPPLPLPRRVVLSGALVKVYQDLLLGTTVGFDHDGRTAKGSVEGFDDWEGISMVRLSSGGMHRRRFLTDIPDLSDLADKMREHQELKELLSGDVR